jgi:cytochrome P450/NAD(P)-dependent dehydrogenase (short-subunit alcohol dehydrogenase family)/glutamine cyclotransferase
VQAVAASTSGVWVAALREQALLCIDPETDAVAERVPVDGQPYALAEDGDHLWITDFEASQVLRFDLRRRQVDATVRDVRFPTGLAVGAGAVWVAQHRSGVVQRIDPRTAEITASVQLRGTLEQVAFGHGAVWVAGNNGHALWRIEPSTREVTEVPLGTNAYGVAVDDTGLWVATFPQSGDCRSSSSRVVHVDVARPVPAARALPLRLRRGRGGGPRVGGAGRTARAARPPRGRGLNAAAAPTPPGAPPLPPPCVPSAAVRHPAHHDRTPHETTALVTGASSGIGEATALALAEQGAAVAVAARRRDRLEQLAQRIETAGGRALVLEADVTDQAQAEQAVADTVAQLGRLDTLVNNAGVMLLGPVQDAPVEEWQRMVDLNLMGLLYCTHAALPHLLQAAQDEPRQVADVVNISSVAGRLRARGQRRLQRHEVRGRGLQRVAAPGGHPPARPGLAGRARRGLHRAGRAQPAGGAGLAEEALRRHGAAAVRGHRGRDLLRRHPPTACRHQRAAGAPDGAAALTAARARVRWALQHGVVGIAVRRAAKTGDLQARSVVDPHTARPLPAVRARCGRAGACPGQARAHHGRPRRRHRGAAQRRLPRRSGRGRDAARARQRHALVRGPAALGPIDPPSLLVVEPPDHTKYRRLVSRVFTGRGRRGAARAGAGDRRRAARRAEGQPTADWSSPTAAGCRSRHHRDPRVRPEDRERVLGFGRDGAPSLDVGLTWQEYRVVDDAVRGFQAWLGGHLERLRREPGEDLLSQLVRLEDEGQRLDETELRAVAGLVLAAGFETTVNLLGSGTVLLLERPDQLARLREDPSLWPNAVDEVLRYESPVQLTARFALRSTDLAGRTVPRGGLVVTMLGGGNRDPEVFSEPDAFDVGRENARDHLSFSGGRHFCLGRGARPARGRGRAADAVRPLPRAGARARAPPHPHPRPARLGAPAGDDGPRPRQLRLLSSISQAWSRTCHAKRRTA